MTPTMGEGENEKNKNKNPNPNPNGFYYKPNQPRIKVKDPNVVKQNPFCNK